MDIAPIGHREVSFEGKIQLKYKHGIVETRQISHSSVQPALIYASAVVHNLNKGIGRFIHLEAVVFWSLLTVKSKCNIHVDATAFKFIEWSRTVTCIYYIILWLPGEPPKILCNGRAWTTPCHQKIRKKDHENWQIQGQQLRFTLMHSMLKASLSTPAFRIHSFLNPLVADE